MNDNSRSTILFGHIIAAAVMKPLSLSKHRITIHSLYLFLPCSQCDSLQHPVPEGLPARQTARRASHIVGLGVPG